MRDDWPGNPNQDALTRILKVVAVKSARSITFVAAVLGMVYLIPGVELPPELKIMATTLGVELMGSVIDRVASGKDMSDDEIKRAVEDAVARSVIDKALTKDDFYQAFSHLRKGQRSLQVRDDEILTILQRVESALSLEQPQELSAEELQQIRERLIRHLNRQITKEKNSKRYIPDVLVEVARIKAKARLFAHPVMFLRKTIEDIKRLNFSELNRILLKLSVEPFSIDLPVDLEEVNSIGGFESQASQLMDVLQNVRKDLIPFSVSSTDPSLATAIPTDKRYLYDEVKFRLREASSSLEQQLGERTDDLKVIRSRVLFVIARAGQGKTNFVCDFAENVLHKRSLPCLFFTGQELRHVDPDRIGEYVVRSVFGEKYNGSIEEMLVDLEKVCLADQAPLTIVIDGINDHSDISVFSHRLEKFIERILEYRFIKILMTCRSEYFDQRFDNFKRTSYVDSIYFVEDFERCMNDMHRSHMLGAYFRFFKLNCKYLSERAAQTLERDTLLLRMFCEAYGDHNAAEVIQLPQVMDIYKDEVFRLFLDKKIEGVSQRFASSSHPSVGVGARYKRVLSQIIRTMIQRRQFADIPVTDLGEESYAPLGEMIDEGLIFRKDLGEGRSVLDEQSEVINFTFDEFRDFLLADHLVMVIFNENIEAFKNTVDHLTDANSPVAEGISKYIFFTSKRPEHQEVYEVVADSPWYKQVFLECIFSLREELILQGDLREIKSKFCESADHSRRITYSLIGRYRTDIYPALNILLLFEIFDALDESMFSRLVTTALERPHWVYDRWPIEQLAGEIRGILMNENLGDWPCFENLAELLIYLFGIRSSDGAFPAYEVFDEFAERRVDVAVGLLKKHIRIRNSLIAAQVWQILTDLSYDDRLPIEIANELVTDGRHLLSESRDDEDMEHSRLSRAIRSFLISRSRLTGAGSKRDRLA